MESVEKWAAIYRKKPSRDWLEKDQWESVISVQSLSCIFLTSVRRKASKMNILIKAILKFCTTNQLFKKTLFSVGPFWW